MKILMTFGVVYLICIKKIAVNYNEKERKQIINSINIIVNGYKNMISDSKKK